MNYCLEALKSPVLKKSDGKFSPINLCMTPNYRGIKLYVKSSLFRVICYHVFMTNIAAASFETMHVYGVDRPYSILEP